MPIYYGGTQITPIIHLPPKVQQKTITENGVYNASDVGLDGYSSVTVNVNNKFSSLVDKTIITITASDLNGAIKIGKYALAYCPFLTSITIPDTVSFIDDNAFNGSSNLTSITIESTTPPELANSNAFDNTNDCPIYVPASSVNAYKAASNWVNVSSRIQAIIGGNDSDF